jgi:uncharacterized membrane protein
VSGTRGRPSGSEALRGSEAPRGPTDALDRAIARLLAVAIVLSVAILGIGVLLMLLDGRSALETSVPAFDPGRLPGDVLALRPEGFVWLGLLAVVATPASRVLASLVGYLRTGDRRMAVIAAAILSVIAASVAVGLIGI